MKYRCLVLDHDDTVVNSTATVHYPCFQAFLDQVRPGSKIRLEDYFLESFDGSFLDMCRRNFALTDAELGQELEFWNGYVANHVPTAYDGMRELLLKFRSQGGKLCVVSHSLSWNILRDYEKNGLPQPDLVFGWDDPPQFRKPNPYPLRRIMRELDLSANELLMVDDMKPGYDMARCCSVDFAAAGWANEIDPIRRFMQEHCDFYLYSVADLKTLLFE